MLNIVLFGPPGAGKGTQSQKLIDTYGLTHLSTGDILRNEILTGTALGIEAKQIMDRGDLVDDDIVISMIESKIDSEAYAKGFIFDGFPRTQAQAVALDDLLQKKGTAISGMLALEVDNDELVKRLLLRGKQSGRADDQNQDIIRNRVNEYNTKTLPLKKYYSEQNKFHAINGIGTIESIFEDMCERLIFIQAEIELTMLENDIEHLDLTINDFEVATEVSDELKNDIEAVRKADDKKAAKSQIKVTPQKQVNMAFKTSISKTTTKKSLVNDSSNSLTKKNVLKKVGAKKAIKKPISNALVRLAPKNKIVKNGVTKNIVVKKLAPKNAIKKLAPKKVIKKLAPKKAIKKSPPKNAIKKLAPKKVIKKLAPKKAIKKSPPKNAIKKLAPKKVIKKLAPKKAIKKSPPKKVVKTVSYNKSLKSVSKKLPSKKVIKKAIEKKKVASKKVASKKVIKKSESKVIKSKKK